MYYLFSGIGNAIYYYFFTDSTSFFQVRKIQADLTVENGNKCLQ